MCTVGYGVGDEVLLVRIKSNWVPQNTGRAFVFVRKAILPLLMFFLVFLWSLSSLVLILPHETGLRFQFGVPDSETLSPGVHMKWPWPWGEIRRVPSARILSMKIGHEEEENEVISKVLDEIGIEISGKVIVSQEIMSKH